MVVAGRPHPLRHLPRVFTLPERSGLFDITGRILRNFSSTFSRHEATEIFWTEDRHLPFHTGCRSVAPPSASKQRIESGSVDSGLDRALMPTDKIRPWSNHVVGGETTEIFLPCAISTPPFPLINQSFVFVASCIQANVISSYHLISALEEQRATLPGIHFLLGFSFL